MGEIEGHLFEGAPGPVTQKLVKACGVYVEEDLARAAGAVQAKP